jgi:ankyrin repeat protein
MKGDTNAIKAMLKGGGHVCLAKLQYGSALHYACGIGDEDFVRAVIAHGADLDSRVKALLQVVEYL